MRISSLLLVRHRAEELGTATPSGEVTMGVKALVGGTVVTMDTDRRIVENAWF